MTFKANWEKTALKHQLPQGLIEQMVALAIPNKKLHAYELIPGGCANLNIKIKLDTEDNPFILRIYLRNPQSTYLEQELGKLLGSIVPLPQIYYIGDIENYRFAITEFIPGITLRDLLLSDQSHDMPSIMFNVGQILAKINKQKLPSLFPQNIAHDDYLLYAKNTLNNIGNKLSKSLITQIYEIFEKNMHLMPVDNEHIMHGDFDPANILVDKVNPERSEGTRANSFGSSYNISSPNRAKPKLKELDPSFHSGSAFTQDTNQDTWQITGIIDWEFASAGPFLWDIANMLRYTHQMPEQFEYSFLEGLKSQGVVLQNNWRLSVHMFNLESLIDLLNRTDPKGSPNQYADIAQLIDYIIGEFSQSY